MTLYDDDLALNIFFLTFLLFSGAKRKTFSTFTEAERDNMEWTLTLAQKQQRLEDQRLGKRKAAATEEPASSQLETERRRNVYEYNVKYQEKSLLLRD